MPDSPSLKESLILQTPPTKAQTEHTAQEGQAAGSHFPRSSLLLSSGPAGSVCAMDAPPGTQEIGHHAELEGMGRPLLEV